MALINDDCLNVMKKMEAETVDSIVTDPPYGISAFSKDWDKTLPSIEIWKECFRVLKPGAFAFIMCASRSNLIARLVLQLEDIGFNTDFTPLYWVYHTGFPKTHKLKGIDGAYKSYRPKPAVECIIIVMKNMNEKNHELQFDKNGKSITWLDDVRIPTNEQSKRRHENSSQSPFMGDQKDGEWNSQDEDYSRPDWESHQNGRFPANLLIDDFVLGENSKFYDINSWFDKLPLLDITKPAFEEKNAGIKQGKQIIPEMLKSHRPTALTNPENWKTLPTETPFGGTNRNSNNLNTHFAIKPIKLMSYLIKLGSRKGDVILDPFIGSGTTAIACVLTDRKYIGVEMDKEYYEIAVKRLRHHEKKKSKIDYQKLQQNRI